MAGAPPPFIASFARAGLLLAQLCVIGVIVLASAEAAARLDDWLRRSIPFTESVDEGTALKQREPWGYRGRPLGKLGLIELNAQGFRGPRLINAPGDSCAQVMMLGASETLGSADSARGDFASYLRDSFKGRCVEIINTAIAGMTVTSMRVYWENWLVPFRPAVVVIYPPTHLHISPPSGKAPAEKPKTPPPPPTAQPFRSRFVDRLHNVIRQPQALVKWRNAKFIRETLAAHPPSWVIDTPPPESIAALDDEIRALIESIRRTGAIPILATHAMRATDPPRAEDMGALEEMRVFVPRFPPATIIAFNTAANDSLRSLARQLDVPVADVARTLDGRAECFLDLVHFTGAGNALVASVMAPQIAAALDQLPRAAHAVQ